MRNLHSDNNKLGEDFSLTEKGAVVNGRGDTPNAHDILTGSNTDGTLSSKDEHLRQLDQDSAGSTRVGHHDKQGGGDAPDSSNSAHDTKG